MEQLPMLFSPRVSTGATILALQIASMSITGWRTIGLCGAPRFAAETPRGSGRRCVRGEGVNR